VRKTTAASVSPPSDGAVLLGPSADPGPPRRLVITVCPREEGTVRLAIDRGGKKHQLGATGLARSLREIATARGLDDFVAVREGCAGGCSRRGPNVDVTIHLAALPGAKPDHVAIGWKTYVYSLPSLDCVAAIIDENLHTDEGGVTP